MFLTNQKQDKFYLEKVLQASAQTMSQSYKNNFVLNIFMLSSFLTAALLIKIITSIIMIRP